MGPTKRIISSWQVDLMKGCARYTLDRVPARSADSGRSEPPRPQAALHVSSRLREGSPNTDFRDGTYPDRSYNTKGGASMKALIPVMLIFAVLAGACGKQAAIPAPSKSIAERQLEVAEESLRIQKAEFEAKVTAAKKIVASNCWEAYTAWNSAGGWIHWDSRTLRSRRDEAVEDERARRASYLSPWMTTASESSTAG